MYSEPEEEEEEHEEGAVGEERLPKAARKSKSQSRSRTRSGGKSRGNSMSLTRSRGRTVSVESANKKPAVGVEDASGVMIPESAGSRGGGHRAAEAVEESAGGSAVPKA